MLSPLRPAAPALRRTLSTLPSGLPTYEPIKLPTREPSAMPQMQSAGGQMFLRFEDAIAAAPTQVPLPMRTRSRARPAALTDFTRRRHTPTSRRHTPS